MSSPQEQMVSSLQGMVSALVLGGVLSIVGDVMMAFVFGVVGAIGGLIGKILFEYVKKLYDRFKQWRTKQKS